MIYNIDFEIAAFIIQIFFLIYFSVQYESMGKGSRYFKMLLVSVMLAAGLDCVTAITISYPYSIPVWLNYVCNVAYFMSVAASVYSMAEYFRIMITGENKRNFVEKLNVIIFVVHLIICITNPFTKLQYYFNENREYTHGILYYEVYVVPTYYSLYSFFRVISSKEKITKKQFLSMFAFLLLSEAGTVMQALIFKNILMSIFASSIGAMVLLFAFETPDYPLLIRTTKELEKSREQLSKALLAAEEASRAKTIFLSNMSHDIRTPMNAIVGFTELALEHADDPNEVKDCLGTIRTSSEHLLSLINDVLDMSRIESGKIKVEPVKCDLKEVLKDLKGIIQANVNERKLGYEESYEGISNQYVMCDRLRLNQILLNCIGNSVKFTPEGGTITVRVYEENTEKENTGRYVFCLKDTGIGMSKEFLEHIFEPFERETTSTISKTQGTGLGMAITKNLVEMMGGHIRVESEINVGTEYIISFEFERIAGDDFTHECDKADVSMEDMIAALEGKKFLVVDDNKVNRRIVVRILSERGMTIEEAESGFEAIERLENIGDGEFDMIFMDIQMPVMDGYDTTRKIRQSGNPVLEKIPVLAMTANAFEEDRKMALECGMNGHIAKPFKLDALITTLYSMLCVDK